MCCYRQGCSDTTSDWRWRPVTSWSVLPASRLLLQYSAVQRSVTPCFGWTTASDTATLVEQGVVERLSGRCSSESVGWKYAGREQFIALLGPPSPLANLV